MIKPLLSPVEAISRIKEGDSVMVGGFNYGGIPFTLVEALCDAGTKKLHLISNDALQVDDEHPRGVGQGALIVNRQVRKITASHIGLNKEAQRQYNEGTLELELVPQGTFVERIRAGGFGLGGFLTPTGVGTFVEEGKRVMEIDGKRFILERPLRANTALIRAHRADRYGNLTYRGTNRNFNPVMATAADLVIVEVDSVVDVGDLAPNDIITPGIVVDILVLRGDSYYASRT